MKRSTLILLGLLFTAGSASGQIGTPTGISTARPADATTSERLLEVGEAAYPELRRPGSGTGLSGSLRIVVSGASTPLDLSALRQFGGGWEKGHRWVPLGERMGRTLLGEPAPVTASEFTSPEIVTPEPAGSWRLESGDGATVIVVNPLPASAREGPLLNGYHIGRYPTEGSDRDDAYAPPEAFIEVTPDTRDLPISKHLTLGQFLTKDQFEVWPKYVALDLRLVDKLELVVQELNAMGIRADRMHVMSGFRTPQYNGPGGDGRASLSRHMWGDAADVWIDNDSDGLMDDLNGDGQIDMDDAAVMMRAVERIERRYPELVGGAGVYPTTSTHGPYIHIDARGVRARW